MFLNFIQKYKIYLNIYNSEMIVTDDKSTIFNKNNVFELLTSENNYQLQQCNKFKLKPLTFDEFDIRNPYNVNKIKISMKNTLFTKSTENLSYEDFCKLEIPPTISILFKKSQFDC
jgi:hypothetical protein